MEKDLTPYFLLQRYELIIKNSITRLFMIGDVKQSQRRLLDLVSIAGKVSDITFLEKDTDIYLQYLYRWKERSPELAGSINDQIDWVNTILIPAIQKRKKVIYRKLKQPLNENYLDIIVEQSLIDVELYPLFILLTNTESPLSKLMNFFAKDPYDHVAISFDSSLENMYSFGVKDNLTSEVFIKEASIKSGYFQRLSDCTTYSLYYVPLPKESIDSIKNLINLLKTNKMKFSISGLFNKNFNRIKEFGEQYFCSWFVADLLGIDDGVILSKYPNIHDSHGITFLPTIQLISFGTLNNYDKTIVDENLRKK